MSNNTVITYFYPHLRFHLPRRHVTFVGAVVFTIGCFVLVTNAILSFLPYSGSGLHLPRQIIYVEGALSITSNLFFLAGSFFAFVQILNSKRTELYNESKSLHDNSKSQMAVSDEDMGLKAEKSSLPSIETPPISLDDTETRPPSYCEGVSVVAENLETPLPLYRARSSVSGQSSIAPPPYAETSSVAPENLASPNGDAASEATANGSSDVPCITSPDYEYHASDESTWQYAEKMAIKSGIYPTTPSPSYSPTLAPEDSTALGEIPPTMLTGSESSFVSLEHTIPVNHDFASEHNTWLSAKTLAPVMGIYAMTPACSTENLTAGFKADSGQDLERQLEFPYTQVPDDLWRYVPSKHEMWARSIHEIGFLATSIFFCSSLVYFSTSIASFVTIARTGDISRWIRYPQLIAAVGFACASIILMEQVQVNWWRPALHRLRWYVNFLNLVGSAGFIFCACFGLVENTHWARYQFGCSYLWGSWAFLFGSMMQWYKFVNKPARDRRKEQQQQDEDHDREKDLML